MSSATSGSRLPRTDTAWPSWRQRARPSSAALPGRPRASTNCCRFASDRRLCRRLPRRRPMPLCPTRRAAGRSARKRGSAKGPPVGRLFPSRRRGIIGRRRLRGRLMRGVAERTVGWTAPRRGMAHGPSARPPSRPSEGKGIRCRYSRGEWTRPRRTSAANSGSAILMIKSFERAYFCTT